MNFDLKQSERRTVETVTEQIELIVVAIIATAIGWYVKLIGSKVADLPRDYVPRPQVDARFADLERRLENEMQAQEIRSDKRFDSVDTKLDKIIDRLESKVDK